MMEEIEMAAAPAAMNGDACYQLALSYASGRSRPVDLVSAHTWFNIAVLHGCRDAVARRAELASEMTPAELTAALKAARALMTRH